MDKSTLSNYGWIVIAVLVLSVMIALATPFGTYIENGVRSTTQGLFDTSEKAMNVVGMSAGDGQFENGFNSSISKPQANDGKIEYGVDDPDLNPTNIIFENNKYIYGDFYYVPIYQEENPNEFGAPSIEVAKEILKSMLMEQCGMTWNETVEFFIEQGAIQTEDDIWPLCGLTEDTFVPATLIEFDVRVIDKTKTEYGPILESINNIPTTNLDYTFDRCESLTVTGIPKIPNTVTVLSYTFRYCTALTSLNDFVIPNSVTNMEFTFWGCTSLTDISNFIIPNSVTTLHQVFAECTSLADVSNFVIPSSVTKIRGLFSFCTSLTDASDFVIPSNVTDISVLFWDCSNLKSAPVIPETVTHMYRTFLGCKSLTGEIIINTNNISIDDFFSDSEGNCYECFGNVDMTNITLTGSSSKDVLNLIGNTGDNWMPIS